VKLFSRGLSVPSTVPVLNVLERRRSPSLGMMDGQSLVAWLVYVPGIYRSVAVLTCMRSTDPTLPLLICSQTLLVGKATSDLD
jgi:hypothetical protein